MLWLGCSTDSPEGTLVGGLLQPQADWSDFLPIGLEGRGRALEQP